MSYTTEKFIRVYDDKIGSYIEVGPDGDGLDLVDISYNEDNRKISFITNQEHAVEMAKAILELYGDKE